MRPGSLPRPPKPPASQGGSRPQARQPRPFAIRLIAITWLFAIRLIAMRPGSLPRPPKPPASRGGSRPHARLFAIRLFAIRLIAMRPGSLPRPPKPPASRGGSRPHARLFAIRLFAIRLIAMRPGSLPRPPKAGISPGSRLQLGRTAGPYLRPLWPAALQVQGFSSVEPLGPRPVAS